MRPERYQLDNGMTVILYEDHSAPVVAMQVWVAAGSADESEREAGLAHVHEHMLFRGTAKRGVGEIARQIESSGGMINAWTSYDQTVYYIVTASRFAETALDILADAISSSAFDAGELQRELEVIQEEISEGEDVAGMVLSQEIFRAAYRSHPYGRPVIGTRESVAAFSRDDVLEFYHRWYRPEFMTLVLVGDFQRQALTELIDQLFGAQRRSGFERPQRTPEPPQTQTRVTLQFRGIEESHMGVAFHVPGLAHEDIPALELLSILLGQGESSILFRELKRNRLLATDVYAYLYLPQEPGILSAGATFPGSSEEPQDPLEVLEALLVEVFKLTSVPVSQEELERAKTMLESETVYEIETVQGRASRLGYFQVVAGDLAFERRFFETASRISPEEILRVARTYLTPENMTVGFVLPDSFGSTINEEAVLEQVARAHDQVRQLAVPLELSADDHGVVRHQFPGGLTLLIQEDHSVPLVAARAVLPGGSRFETKDDNGINNFLAELLTAGTQTRTSQEIAHQIESMAGSISGFSGRNSIGLQMVVLSRHFQPAFDLFADCLMQSELPEEEVGRIRRDILADIQAQQDDLAGSAFRQMLRLMFRGHPLQFDLLGTRDTVERFEIDDLRSYYQDHFHPGAMTLAIVGDVSAAMVVENVQRIFNVTEAYPRPTIESIPVVRPQRDEVVTHRDRQQAHLVLGFQTVRLDHPDRWPLEVLTAILSAQGGRLFLEMREHQSLAYSVDAIHQPLLDSGFFAVYAATSPEKIEDVNRALIDQINRLHTERVDEQELERAQRLLVGQRAISLQRAGARAAHLVFDEAYGLGYDDSFRFSERIMGVTADDIQRVAREYLVLDHSVLSIVRPNVVVQPDAAASEP